MIQEGYGTGVGSTYKPWIKIQDVPSLGRVTRIKGIKTKRQHELLSDMERNYFYILEFSDKVLDIREQFPLLPLEDTLSIVEELGIRHPKELKTKEDIVMTTDFLITIETNSGIKQVARTVKSKDDLLSRRIIEKFEIEREFWKRRDIDWGIVTEKEINKTIANNISFVREYKILEELDSFNNIDYRDISDYIAEYIKRIVDDTRSIRTISSEFDKDMNLDIGSGLSIFKYLVANKIIEIDITKNIDVNNNIPILRIEPERINKVEGL